MNTYWPGNVVRLSVIFTVAGAVEDPGTVTLKVRNPSTFVVTTYVHGVAAGLIKDSKGHYHLDLSCTIVGSWVYRWEGTFPAEGASEAIFEIKAGHFS